MSKHKWLIAPSAVLLLIGFGLVIAPTSNAQEIIAYQESECYSGQTPYYDALLKVKPGTYDVFVKMGKRGQTTPATLYIENSGATECPVIGSAQANGETWQPIGSWTSNNDDPVRFQLTSELFETLPDANRPAVMLVPKQNPPPCQPIVNCDFTFQGQPAFIMPTGTLLSENNLRVLQVQDPSQDSLKQVDYYSDGQLLYSTPQLEEFDMRYVPGGQHTLSRVLQYESGQKVVLQSSAYVSFAKDFQNLLFRVFHSNKVGIQIIAVITILASLVLATVAVLHALHRRHLWKINHGIIQEPVSEQTEKTPDNYVPPAHFLNENSRTMKNVKQFTPYVLLVLAMFVTIGLTDAYIAQLFRVDGVSMETTLQTDDQLFVNKAPKTWASLNKQEYVPRRGEIVVFNKAHSDLFLQDNEDERNVFVVKRVLGLPGERVVVRNGIVTVYNSENPDGFNPDQNSSWQTNLTIDPSENIDVSLSQSEIFVSGDNRPESLDSRANGPINVSELVGRVEARVMPFSKSRIL